MFCTQQPSEHVDDNPSFEYRKLEIGRVEDGRRLNVSHSH